MATKIEEETSNILNNVDDTNFAKNKKIMRKKQSTAEKCETTT